MITLDLKSLDLRVPMLRDGIDKYLAIMKKIDPDNDDFRKKFNAFYRVRRNQVWQEEFYKLFDSCVGSCLSFENALDEMYKRTGRVECSFISKMIHTCNINEPIWDQNVLRFLKSELHWKYNQSWPASKKLAAAKKIYEDLESWYAEYLKTPDGINSLTIFDMAYPEAAGISAVKKIDFILWRKGV